MRHSAAGTSSTIYLSPVGGTRAQAPSFGSSASPLSSTSSAKLPELSSRTSVFPAHSLSLPPVLRSRSRLLGQRQALPNLRRPSGTASASLATEALPESPAMDAAAKAQSVVQHMRKVFRTGVTKDIKWRQDQLLGLARMIKERETEFYDAIKQDLGRGPSDSYAELLAPMVSAEEAARKVPQWAKPSKVGTDTINLPGSSEVVPEPYGVVLIMGPWNFPFTCLLEPLVGALAAGNAVVLKPSEISPASSAILARLIPQYLDSSAVQVVEGGPEVGIALLEHRWDNIFFTGGTEIGRKIAVAAAKHLTPVTLELGGKNPCYVDSTCDLALACRRIVWGSFLNAGQICLKPEYILVEESFAGKLIEGLKKTALEFYGEDPKQSPDIARIVSDRHFERLTGLLADPRTAECIVHGGQSDKSTRFISPTILRDVPWDCPVMQEETFGPIIAVQTVNSVEEAIAIINDRNKPLALYAFTSTQDSIQKIIAETSSGAVVTNEVVTHILNPYLPFGGVGASGMGSYHGKYSFDCFSHHKAVLKKGSLGDVPFRYPPSNPYKNSLMRALFSFDFLSLILILVGLKK